MSFQLPEGALAQFRDQLRSRGRARRSMVIPSAAPDVIEAMEILEEYGAMCEVMYLMMYADRKVLNVEREVMRGALDILSAGRVRTAHMEAMIDASARRVAELGEKARLERVIDQLRDDPVRAEITVLLAAAVAVADGAITPEEQELLSELASGLALESTRAEELLGEMVMTEKVPESRRPPTQ